MLLASKVIIQFLFTKSRTPTNPVEVLQIVLGLMLFVILVIYIDFYSLINEENYLMLIGKKTEYYVYDIYSVFMMAQFVSTIMAYKANHKIGPLILMIISMTK